MNDGIFYEQGRLRHQRAVVERYGQRLTSDWRKTKDAALRDLVIKLAQRLSQRESTVYDWADGEIYYRPPDDLRLVIADGLEALAGAKFAESGSKAELFSINGEMHIVNEIDRLYRGAWVLRWVHRRETR